MSSRFNQMVDDLKRKTPENPVVLGNPYDEGLTIDRNLQQIYRHLLRSIRTGDRILSLVNAYYIGEILEVTALPHERTSIRRILTPYYVEVIRHLYNIYELLVVEQLYRTKDLRISHFRNVSKSSITGLGQE